jgi:hypothetical protein
MLDRMRHAKFYKLLTVLWVCLYFTACAHLTPAQRESGRTSIQDAYEKGQITAAQRDDAITALEGGTTDWSQWLTLGGSVLASILLGVPVSVGVVQKKRGPTEAQRQAAKRA